MSRTRHSTCNRQATNAAHYDGGGRSGRVDRAASSPRTVTVLLEEQMPHLGDGRARARSARPIGVYADVHISNRVEFRMTEPCLKAVASRCCDRARCAESPDPCDRS